MIPPSPKKTYSHRDPSANADRHCIFSTIDRTQLNKTRVPGRASHSRKTTGDKKGNTYSLDKDADKQHACGTLDPNSCCIVRRGSDTSISDAQVLRGRGVMVLRVNPAAYLPTKFSNTELFPALCPPTTAIWGRSRLQLWPMALKASCSRFTSGIRSSIPRLPMADGREEGRGDGDRDGQAASFQSSISRLLETPAPWSLESMVMLWETGLLSRAVTAVN